MTNNEILRADVLDILFENRNKAYGAYALRRTYKTRLLVALGCGLILFFLFVLLATAARDKNTVATPPKADEIIIRAYVLPKEKIKPPETPMAVAKPEKNVKPAKAKFTSKIEIKKDDLVKSTVKSVENLKNKEPGPENTKGKPADGTLSVPESPVNGNGSGNASTPEVPKVFVAVERNPEFPGGPEALHKFLSRNLNTPEDLEAGEKKVVKIKFKVGKDGIAGDFEIVTSGGNEFDNEVLRVCKKMPRWSPALQNGMNIEVNYMIPVTFVGPE